MPIYHFAKQLARRRIVIKMLLFIAPFDGKGAKFSQHYNLEKDGLIDLRYKKARSVTATKIISSFYLVWRKN